MNDEEPSVLDKRMSPHLLYFADRTNLLFAWHFCTLEFLEDEDFALCASENDRAWSLKTIQNACLHTTLMSIRDLDDFFTPRNERTKKDDLRASDFNFNGSHSFLSRDERQKINKLIAHTTQVGATQLGYRWDLLELITKSVMQCDTFLDWIKETYSAAHLDTYIAALTTQAKTKAILAYIKKRTDEEQQKHAEQSVPPKSDRAGG